MDNVLWSKNAQKMEAARFFAISLVIWEHCLLGVLKWDNTDRMHLIIRILFEQIGRQGTVMFFVISGFFLSKKLVNDHLSLFLKRRFGSVILPWAIFTITCVLIQVFEYYLQSQKKFESAHEMTSSFFAFLVGALFYAGYWFVPISIFSGVVLVIYRKYSAKLWFGIILLIVTLLYNANLYLGWFSANHSKAFFGYIFYVWLGVQLSYHLRTITQWISKIPSSVIITLVLVSTVISGLEGKHLSEIGCADPFGSIRITNGVTSVLQLLLFLKEGYWNKSTGLRLSRTVFGMYLGHMILIVLTNPILQILIDSLHPEYSMISIITTQMAWFVFILYTSYFMAKGIGRSE